MEWNVARTPRSPRLQVSGAVPGAVPGAVSGAVSGGASGAVGESRGGVRTRGGRSRGAGVCRVRVVWEGVIRVEWAAVAEGWCTTRSGGARTPVVGLIVGSVRSLALAAGSRLRASAVSTGSTGSASFPPLLLLLLPLPLRHLAITAAFETGTPLVPFVCFGNTAVVVPWQDPRGVMEAVSRGIGVSLIYPRGWVRASNGLEYNVIECNVSLIYPRG